MQNFTIKLTNCLIKRYNLTIAQVTNIIDDEWEYIEEELACGNSSVEHVAKELVDIYMVA